MRLFIAVDLDEPARAAAAADADALARQLAKGPAAPRIAWVPAGKLHLTVRFLGQVPDEKAAALAGAFQRGFKTAAFEASLSGLGVFPETGSPRVVWIGIGDGAASFQALHREVEAGLAPFGFEPEGRPFSAHLTLGRVREARGSAARIRETLARELRRPARWRVDRLTLYESRLSPKGPTYVPVAYAPLGAAA